MSTGICPLQASQTPETPNRFPKKSFQANLASIGLKLPLSNRSKHSTDGFDRPRTGGAISPGVMAKAWPRWPWPGWLIAWLAHCVAG
jgi:hypothetical protein